MFDVSFQRAGPRAFQLRTRNMALQAFGAIWWLGFGDDNPQLPRVMVLPVDISDNIADGTSASGM